MRPSDCSNGAITVTFPDGTQTTVKDIAGCCYSYPGGCYPCLPNDAYQDFVKQHFNKCVTGQCLVSQNCGNHDGPG